MDFEFSGLLAFEFCAVNLKFWSFEISNLESRIRKGGAAQ